MRFPAFTITVTREAAVWTAKVTDGLDGATGEFKQFGDVDPGMRKVVANLTGLPAERFHLRWRYEFDDADATELVLQYQEADRLAEEVTRWREGVRARLVTTLNGQIPQRAIADLVGLSHQRVNQITHGPVPAAAEVVKPGTWVPRF
ncbi:hypothetical protein AB0C38_44005 [Amycolatopsis sp. NPDC048633]|uniref:hypothetical protein n=1 Tax=Amycolatopsis sp. NPDC048633 TaxID=3157095 RepID=UPI003404AA72